MAGRGFVIRPFGTKKDSSGSSIDFDVTHDKLIQPALDATELAGSTTVEIVDSGNIRADMFELILEADVVICDITIHNANVWYELGIRHALRKKSTIMINGEPSADDTPFDISTDRYLAYKTDDPAAAKGALIAMIKASRRSDRETDSPVFGLVPDLQEADLASVRVVPLDFREEVERAKAAKRKGWLRLLSEEVLGLRFQWQALELVGQAQWDLKDWDGARVTWEAIRDNKRDHVAANLALANIYHRLSRDGQDAELLERSDQAIQRVLSAERLSLKDRAEALSLRGRNMKTRWKLDFDGVDDLSERRQRATSKELLDSYWAYREAFLTDLNAYWPGLAALQMATIALSLSDDEAWLDLFDSESDAEKRRADLAEEVAGLRAAVDTSVEAGLSKIATDEKDVWAEISSADAKFLTQSGRASRVVKAYQSAIPRDNPFAWEAAKRQLELFASLGVQAELAGEVIAAIDGEVEAARTDDPSHVIVFAGHRVDGKDRPERRFPAAKDGAARDLIRSKLREVMREGHDHTVLASAAPGSDIVLHEVCLELGIDSQVCLPMPSKAFAVSELKDLDTWRTRYLDLIDKRDPIVLSDRKGLPDWLAGKDKDPWERGNEWVMNMAEAAGASRITLVVLWDGKDAGDAPGGTAHMVRIAKLAGTIDIHRIDSTQLLA